MSTRQRKSLAVDEDGILLIPTLDTEIRGVHGGVVDVYAESSTQKYPLGTKAVRGEEAWVYCLNGATGLNIAAPIQSAAAQHAECPDDIVVGAAAAIGDTSIELTSTANLAGTDLGTANTYAGGYIVVNDEAGEGQCCKIKSHDAFSGTSDATINLYDALTVALTTSSQVGIIPSPYYKVIATTAVVTGHVVGVPQMAVTANYYFWCKCRGPAAVVVQAAIALGTMAIVGTTAAKADPAAAATTEIPLGWPVTVGVADTEKCIIWLQCD